MKAVRSAVCWVDVMVDDLAETTVFEPVAMMAVLSADLRVVILVDKSVADSAMSLVDWMAWMMVSLPVESMVVMMADVSVDVSVELWDLS